jgi:hypothetical protein
MKTKYLFKKRTLSLNNPNEEIIVDSPPFCLLPTYDKKTEEIIINKNTNKIQCSNENKHQLYITMNESQIIDSNCKFSFANY